VSLKELDEGWNRIEDRIFKLSTDADELMKIIRRD